MNKVKLAATALTLAMTLGLAGACGSSASAPLPQPAPKTTAVTTATDPAPAVLAPANLTITVLPGGRLGPNAKKGHDAFSPYAFTVYAGQTVNMTALDYDNMPHSMTAYGAGTKLSSGEVPGGVADANPGGLLVVNAQFTGSKTGNIDMTPGVTHFSFTAPSKPGVYYFQCIDPCDKGNGQWSMSHYGYMIGKVVVRADPS